MSLDKLIEAFLTEAALAKGSQRVMNDAKMVAALARRLRSDADFNPSSFPRGADVKFEKMPDQELAQWFLENLDRIEREGYEGTVYSRDGANSEWITRKYVEGKHNWEDITGVMNMNLRDWYVLKNRGMLDANHTDIPKFNSVRDIGKYMNLHYEDKLKDVRDAAKNAAINKMAKSACIVDNDDYKIYTVFNWAAARRLGLGTQWCTANSSYDGNYDSYSKNMLFQLYPKDAEEVVKTGKVVGVTVKGTEKYQFDAGGSFQDLADDPAHPAEIKEKFPYLYSDLVKGLSEKKTQIEDAVEQLQQDPVLMGSKEGKIRRAYKITDEIKKLSSLKKYFTDEVRPKEQAEEVPSNAGAEEPAQQPQLGNNQPPQGQQAMEKVDKDVAAMLESLRKYDILKESVAPVLGMRTLTGATLISEKNTDDTLAQRPNNMIKNYGKELKYIKNANSDEYKKAYPIDGPKGKLPEAEDVDEAAKKSDIPAVNRKKSGKPDWMVTKDDLTKEKSDNLSSKEGIDKAKEKTNIKEEADQEVLDWMQRFSKLGNMKGYGR